MSSKNIKLADRLIISIDVSQKQQVTEMCRKISGKVSTLKIGLELIYSQGLSIVDTIKSFGYKVMLDSKLHDIPNTVSGACRAITSLGVSAVTVHTLGGPGMIGDARKAIADRSEKMGVFAPLLMGVTVLTSLDDRDMGMMGFGDGYMDTVACLASMGISAGLDGIVCSPREVKVLRQKLGSDFYIATPGIRLKEDSSDDQKRAATPQQALADGADFLVVGRSITAKKDIPGTIDKYLHILGGF
ncbi:MAG: orotidine-5'-phosphate decarboxylase [Actinomycetota bacterium]